MNSEGTLKRQGLSIGLNIEGQALPRDGPAPGLEIKKQKQAKNKTNNQIKTSRPGGFVFQPP